MLTGDCHGFTTVALLRRRASLAPPGIYLVISGTLQDLSIVRDVRTSYGQVLLKVAHLTHTLPWLHPLALSVAKGQLPLGASHGDGVYDQNHYTLH